MEPLTSVQNSKSASSNVSYSNLPAHFSCWYLIIKLSVELNKVDDLIIFAAFGIKVLRTIPASSSSRPHVELSLTTINGHKTMNYESHDTSVIKNSSIT